MTYWIYSSLHWSLALAGCYVWASSAILLIGMLWPNELEGLKVVSTLSAWRTLAKVGRWAVILSIGVTGGIPLGMGILDKEYSSRIRTRYGLEVLERNSPTVYQMRTESNKDFQAVFCESAIFRKGDKIKELTYEDRATCWHIKGVKLGYILAKEGQDYGYANTYTNTYARSNSHPNPYTRP